jgi:hypothetical protein
LARWLVALCRPSQGPKDEGVHSIFIAIVMRGLQMRIDPSRKVSMIVNVEHSSSVMLAVWTCGMWMPDWGRPMSCKVGIMITSPFISSTRDACHSSQNCMFSLPVYSSAALNSAFVGPRCIVCPPYVCN